MADFLWPHITPARWCTARESPQALRRLASKRKKPTHGRTAHSQLGLSLTHSCVAAQFEAQLGARGESVLTTISALVRHINSPAVAQWACTALVKQLRCRDRALENAPNPDSYPRRTKFNAAPIAARITESIRLELGDSLAKASSLSPSLAGPPVAISGLTACMYVTGCLPPQVAAKSTGSHLSFGGHHFSG